MEIKSLCSSGQMIQGLEDRTNKVEQYKLTQVLMVYMNSRADGKGVLLCRKMQNNQAWSKKTSYTICGKWPNNQHTDQENNQKVIMENHFNQQYRT